MADDHDEEQPSGLYYKMLAIGDKIRYCQETNKFGHGVSKIRWRMVEVTEVIPIWDGKCAYRGEYVDGN